MSEGEVWRDVVGYEGLYKVSDRGNVYSLERIYANGRKRNGLTLKPSCDRGGYLRLELCKNGIRKRKYVHRIVAEAFIPNPNNYPEINHKDENKTNNYVENLEWCTRGYNVNFGRRNEKSSQKLSKKVRAINVETDEVLTFSSVKEAVSKGYAHGAISEACRGVYKTNDGKLIGDGYTYRGHRWSYQEEGE